MQFEPFDMLYRQARADVTAWRPAAVGSRWARACRLIQDARFVALCEQHGAGLWRLRPVQDDDVAGGYRIVLAHPCGDARLYLKASGHGVLAMILSTSAVDPVLSRAVLTSWLGSVLGVAGIDILSIDRPDEPLASRTERDRADWLAFSLPPELGPGSVVIEHLADALMRRLQSACASIRHPLHPVIAATRLPGALLGGESRMAAAMVRSLSPGDIVLGGINPGLRAMFSHSTTGLVGDVTFIVRWGMQRGTRLAVKVALGARSLTVMDSPYMINDSRGDADDSGAGPDIFLSASLDAAVSVQRDPPQSPVAVDQLDLPVQFEIATVALEVAYLSALTPGHVIELPGVSAEPEVRLIAYGQTLGYGTLVSVGEHIGIKISRMA